MFDGRNMLRCTLRTLAELAVGLAEPWWIVGSAAAVLVGLDDEPVADIDVVAGKADARQLLARLGAVPRAVPSDRFRSSIFGRADGLAVPVDVMGDLAVREDGAWRPLRIRSRLAVAAGPAFVYVPDAVEQARICRLFGRPKDISRAERLEKMSSGLT